MMCGTQLWYHRPAMPRIPHPQKHSSKKPSAKRAPPEPLSELDMLRHALQSGDGEFTFRDTVFVLAKHGVQPHLACQSLDTIGFALCVTLGMPLDEVIEVVVLWCRRFGFFEPDLAKIAPYLIKSAKKRHWLTREKSPDVQRNAWPHYRDLPSLLVGAPYDATHLDPTRPPPLPNGVVSMTAFRERRMSATTMPAS